VLGATGFIGRWVARALCLRGANVHLAVRNASSLGAVSHRFGIRGHIVELDLLDSESVDCWLSTIRPSIVFNLAGYGVDRSENDERTAYRVNAELVLRICQTVAGSRDPNWPGQDIVHIGSALEYGDIGGELLEDSVAKPTTLYGRSKLAGTGLFQRAQRMHRTKGVVARLFTVYGPGEHPGRLLPSLLEGARSGAPVSLSGGLQKRDFTYVEDVAEGLLRLGLAAARPGEIVNLATGKLTSVRSFAETAADVLQFPRDRLRFGSLPNQFGEMEHGEVTIHRLRRLTGWAPRTGIAEGIEKTLARVSQPEPCVADR
jgi:UDP-glucose 4-epimerase